MKKVISIFLCAAMLTFTLAACSGADNRLSVTTAKVKSTDTLATADYSGVIHSVQSTAVIPSVSAKIASVSVKLGQQVNAGDVLMQLDTSDSELALKQAQAGLDTANANYQKAASAGSKQAETQTHQALVAAQNEMRDASANYKLVKDQFDKSSTVAPAQAAYDHAKSEFDRISYLVSIGEESQNDLKNAQSSLTSAAAQLESAKATAQTTLNAADSRQKNAQIALKTAQENYDLTLGSINPENVNAAKASVDSAAVAVEIAQKRISDSTVKAPISGAVGAVNVKAGDLAVQQTPSFQIIGDSNMEVTVNVTETMVRKLTAGTKATVILAATGEKLSGSVTEVAAMATAQNGMFTVKVGIDNATGLKDGMQASVSFLGSSNSGTVLVPTKSILTRDGKSIVFAARSGKAVQVEVTSGEVQGAYTSVKGLNAEDEVIVQGANKAQNGADLHIVSNTNG